MFWLLHELKIYLAYLYFWSLLPKPVLVTQSVFSKYSFSDKDYYIDVYIKTYNMLEMVFKPGGGDAYL